jgi:RHS repeat-associated protein
MDRLVPYTIPAVQQNTLGNIAYEITNYLGNVNVVISDRKIWTGTPTSAFKACVVSRTDYFPFGMEISSRTSNSDNYRFGYNGMESDNETKGSGNSYTTEFRQYDPRLGRWLSLDPLMAQYPMMSPYVAFNNNPIYFVDPLGLEGVDPGEPKTHSLKKGETLSHLSKKYEVSIENLQKWNPSTIGRETKLQIGEEIIVSDPEINEKTLSHQDRKELFDKFIVNREEWGAKDPIRGNDRSYDAIQEDENYESSAQYYNTIAIHHAGNRNNPTIQEIQIKHQNGGKADIGYHFAIDKDGKIYEGRPLNIKGAHVDKANTGVIGIVLLGDFQPNTDLYYIFGIPDKGSVLTREMKNSLIILTTYLNIQYKIENGIGGHGDLNCGHTLCPGATVNSFIPALQKITGLKAADCINYEGSGD